MLTEVAFLLNLNMRTSVTLFQKSSYDLAREISWSKHGGNHYCIRDPANSDSLLYLNEGQYNKLIRVMLSSDVTIEVIATPVDTQESINRKFPESTKTPKQVVLRQFLFNLVPSWKVKGSMISLDGNIKSFLPIYYKHIISWLGLKPGKLITKSIWKLSGKVSNYHEKHGINHVILRLKISTIVILKYLGGEKVSNTQSLGMRIRLRHGLPAMLPYPLRFLLRSKNLAYTRVLVSLFYSYKGLSGVYNDPSFSTIVAERFSKLLEVSGDLLSSKLVQDLYATKEMTKELTLSLKDKLRKEMELRRAIKAFWSDFNPKGIKPDLVPDWEQPPLIMTAGPNSPVSFVGAGMDAVAHITEGMDSPIFKYINVLKTLFPVKDVAQDQLSLFKDLIIQTAMAVNQLTRTSRYEKLLDFNLIPGLSPKKVIKERIAPRLSKVLSYTPSEGDKLKLGKLSLKYEAAGKVRVFAIADYWTQWILKPLHESIFKLLKTFPSDATFDQLGKVKTFQARGYTYIASFDLKAATDLIPQQLYVEVLRPWCDPDNKGFAPAWLELLVNRDYHIKIKNEDLKFKYTRGQPMGTLSSWASLALVHHFLVFLAAYRVNVKSFRDYLVLGDDIIIANKKVAESYLSVCSDWGITVGLPKSFVSDSGFFQFASQDVLSSDNISPISLKEVLAVNAIDTRFFERKGIVSLPSRIEFVNRLVWKGFIGDNLLSLLRACYSPLDWNKISRSLSKGILPLSLVPTLLMLALSRERANSVTLVQVMSFIKGDYHGSINGRDLPLKEQQMFLYAILESLDTNIKETIASLVKSISSGRSSFLLASPLRGLVTTALMSRNTRILNSFAELLTEWESISSSILPLLMADQIEIFFLDKEHGSSEIQNRGLYIINEYMRLLSKVSSLSLEVELDSKVLSPKSNTELRKVKAFLAQVSRFGGTRENMPLLEVMYKYKI